MVDGIGERCSDSYSNFNKLIVHREHGKEEVSEFTINKVECYYLMNEYLSKLKNTNIKTVEDVVRFNDENSGSQGANPGDHPAFPSGQVRRRIHLPKKLSFILTTYQDNFREVVEAKGIKSPAYYSAFAHMRKQCRENGIDAALHPTVNGKKISLDALLFCDVRGAGQQIAAQACTFHSSNNCSEDEILY